MSTRPVAPLPSFNGVAAGATATLNVPLGDTYNAIFLEYREGAAVLANQANMETDITEVRQLINGKVFRRESAQDIIDRLAFYGITFRDGFLPLLYAEPWRETPQERIALVLGTADIEKNGSFQIEVDIVAGATTPTLSAHKDISRIRQNLGTFKHILKKNVPIASTGENTIQFDKLQALEAIHCRSASVNSLKVKSDGIEVFNAIDAVNTQHLQNGGYTPQTGYFHYKPSLGKGVTEVLPMVKATTVKNGKPDNFVPIQDLPFIFDMAAATAFDVIEERIGRL